jgi:hypothetical protein
MNKILIAYIISQGNPTVGPRAACGPSEQLSAAHQGALTYLNFLTSNVSKVVRNPAWRFLTVSTTTSYGYN